MAQTVEDLLEDMLAEHDPNASAQTPLPISEGTQPNSGAADLKPSRLLLSPDWSPEVRSARGQSRGSSPQGSTKMASPVVRRQGLVEGPHSPTSPLPHASPDKVPAIPPTSRDLELDPIQQQDLEEMNLSEEELGSLYGWHRGGSMNHQEKGGGGEPPAVHDHQPEAHNDAHAPLGAAEKRAGEIRFRAAVKKIMFGARMAPPQRSMSFWQKKSNAKKLQNEYTPRLKRVYPPTHPVYKFVQVLVFVAAMLDLYMVFVEGLAFNDWYNKGSLRAYNFLPELSGWMPLSEYPTERWYLTEGFYVTKIVLGVLSDGVYMVYLFFQVRIIHDTYTDKVWTLRLVASEYLRSYSFAWDFCACAPLYWIFLPIPWLRLNRFLHIYTSLQNMSEFLKYFGQRVNLQILRIIVFLVYTALWVHVIASCTVIVAWQGDDVEDAQAWLSLTTESQSINDWTAIYLRCVLWAWSVVTNGQGPWVPQTKLQMSWTLINQIVGSFVYMVILGQVVSILQNFDLNAAEFSSKRDQIQTFLRLRGAPSSIQARTHSYFDTLWAKKKGMNEHEVLSMLPAFLRHDLSWHLNKNLIEKVPMFSGADASELLQTNQYLTHIVVTPGEFVVRHGELGRHMYFVVSGTLHCLDDEGTVIATLTEGAVVGEISILLQRPVAYDVLAVHTCELFELSEENFRNLSADFPGLRNRLDKRAGKLYGDDYLKLKEELRSRMEDQVLELEGGGDVGESFKVEKDKAWVAKARRASVQMPSSSALNVPEEVPEEGSVDFFKGSTRHVRAGGAGAQRITSKGGAKTAVGYTSSLASSPMRRVPSGLDDGERSSIAERVSAIESKLAAAADKHSQEIAEVRGLLERIAAKISA